MQTKLTLRLEERLIKGMKAYSMRSGKSISQIVADYFTALTAKKRKRPVRHAPLTESLRGILKSTRADEKAYKKYLEEKHL